MVRTVLAIEDFFSSNALSGVKALRLLKRVSYLLIFVIRESKIYIFVIRDPPFFFFFYFARNPS